MLFRSVTSSCIDTRMRRIQGTVSVEFVAYATETWLVPSSLHCNTFITLFRSVSGYLAHTN